MGGGGGGGGGGGRRSFKLSAHEITEEGRGVRR